ncbi:MAG: hypothetical protein JWQ38_464 [Flavipsychrobacter sp.]|nr:hypothetical protein [Flavipsychrobacter sp.]
MLRKITLLVIGLATCFKVFAQDLQHCSPLSETCDKPNITNMGTIYGCVGATYPFTPYFTVSGITATSYSWITAGPTPASGVFTPPSTTIPTTSITVTGTCVPYSLKVNADGPERIQNGGFQTEYSCSTHTCFSTFYGNGCGSSGNDAGHIKVGDFSGVASSCGWTFAGVNCFSHTGDFNLSGSRMLNVHAMNTKPSSPDLPYFWGQTVNLCAGDTYTFSYWVRLYEKYSSIGKLPKIAFYVGSAGTIGHTLQNGYNSYSIVDIAGPFGTSYLGACSTPASWEKHTFTFTAPGGVSFLCLSDYLFNDSKYAIDDISLVRNTSQTSTAITVCPATLPASSITPAPFACVGSSFTFTVTSTPGSVANYTITAPSCTSYTGSVTLTGGVGTVTVPSSCLGTTGNVCMYINSLTIPTSTGPCTLGGVTTNLCVPVKAPVSGTISAPSAVCMGDTFSVSDIGATGAISYSWACDHGTISGSGSTVLIRATSSGIMTVTCTVTSDCGTASTTKTVTVHALPNAGTITGDTIVCLTGLNVTPTYHETVPGGVWSFSSSYVGWVDAYPSAYDIRLYAHGIQKFTMYYTVTDPSTGCSNTDSINISIVLPSWPSTITGPDVYAGCAVPIVATHDYSYPITSESWWVTSGTGTGSLGHFYDDTTYYSYDTLFGLTVGWVDVNYSYTNHCGTYGGHKFFNVLPRPTPLVITGVRRNICVGDTQYMAWANVYTYSWHGIWTSSDTTIAKVTTVAGFDALVSGISAGTAILTFTSDSMGVIPCFNYSDTFKITVLPSVDPIYIPYPYPHFCLGDVLTVYDPSPGGIWTSSISTVATVNTSGVVTSVSVGTTTISYALAGYCPAAKTITVNPVPSVITGPSSVCKGSTIVLSDSISGGVWSSYDTSIVTVTSTGIVTGVKVGATFVSYTLPGGCYKIITITVYPSPGPISGLSNVCVGSTIALSDVSTSGSTWSSSNTAVATVDLLGIVTGVSPGTATITFEIAHGCTATKTITVNPLPANITGIFVICKGQTTVLADASPGGSWTSSNTIVSVSGGSITGTYAGSSVITYTLPTGCYKTATVTVNPPPAPITGPVVVCLGLTSTLSDATPGGIWSSSSTVATVGATTGIVTGIALGTATITYALGTTGCYSTYAITVIPSPIFDSPHTMICEGDSTFITGYYPGGTWSSSDITVASVGSSTGFVLGVSGGTATITYAYTSGCYATVTVTINPKPAPISGTEVVCLGLTQGLSDITPGGSWSTSDPYIAVIDPVTGIYTGMHVGECVSTYTLPTGCYDTGVIFVNPNPVITGLSSICVTNTTTWNVDIVGGTWTSGNTAVATIDPVTGDLYGVSSGTATITYKTTASCIATAVITVNPLPTPIIGIDSICFSVHSFVLSDATSGGTWSSSNTDIAIIGSISGVVTILSAGTVTMTYALGSGCYITKNIKILDVPNVPPIGGPNVLCVGTVVTLYDGYPGFPTGTWSTSSTTVSVSAWGDVTGIALGTGIITYKVTNYCGAASVFDTVTVTTIVQPITGITGVCSGSTTTLHNFSPGGVWASLDASVATIDPVTGVVTGIKTGSATIEYSATGPCGPFIATTIVQVNPDPFITTNFIVACHGSADIIFGHGFTLPAGECSLVCDSTVIRYYGNGVSGSIFTWAVIGGTILANYGDSIDVFWPYAGVTGSVDLTDTFSHCIGSAHACIQVIQKPHAYFSASAISLCLNSSVTFTDLSISDPYSPIVSWNWDFGDGTFSSVESPTHKFTTGNPTNVVRLVVKNECGCSDTFRITLNIADAEGPTIECASVVCDSSIATYTTTPGCGVYNWSVIGGVIISGFGTPSIKVLWNNVDSNGYGYVRLAEPCAACPDTTTIKIPVILKNALIQGPAVLCQGHQYDFELPSWPATEYMWGVLGAYHTYVAETRNYKTAIRFDSVGTYTIHGRYQNKIGLCGGNVYKTVRVVPVVSIKGYSTVCQNGIDSFTLADTSLPVTWILSNISGMVITTFTGTIFNYAFPIPGHYTVSAVGDFCADPLGVTVKELPGTIEGIEGPLVVCLGHLYTYRAINDEPGTTYNWDITGGTLTPLSGTATVNVVWTSGGTKSLTVNRVSTDYPICDGPSITRNYTQEIVRPDVSGDTIPCSNTYRNYTGNYSSADTYDWTILPNTAGSVTTGAHLYEMTALWNNVSAITSASVILTVHKCDTTKSDTLIVNIQPTIGAITASPLPACPNALITLKASEGDSVYTWDFGDGSPIVITADSIQVHGYPENTTTGNINYTVKVNMLPPSVTSVCHPSGSASLTVPILPGPVAYASTLPFVCTRGTGYLIGTVTSGIPTLTYQWYDTTALISGAVSSTYSTSHPSRYHFVVTASNGCSSQSNDASFYIRTCNTNTVCPTPNVHTSNTCNTIYLYGSPGYSLPGYQWSADITPLGGPIPPGKDATASYDKPGIYSFTYTDDDTCHQNLLYYDTVGIVPDFRYRIKCANGGSDTIFLTDHSAYIPGWTITTIDWDQTSVPLGGGPVPASENIYIVRPAGLPNIITETVTGTKSGGRPFSCTVTHTINVPDQPVAAFTAAPSPVCEGVPVTFTPTSTTGIMSYSWDFGDNSYSLRQSPERSYKYVGPADPFPFPVTLTVTDSIGCSISVTNNVGIYQNLLDGDMDLGGIYCSNATPITINYFPASGTFPNIFFWSTGDVTLTPSVDVFTSGDYFVTVYDAKQCQRSSTSSLTAPKETIKIIQTPQPKILGKRDYCDGEMVILSAYVGKTADYKWKRNGAADGTTASVVDASLPVGEYDYEVTITVLDTLSGIPCSATAYDTVHIHPLPPPPVITGPILVDLPSYHIQLTASEPFAGTFNWSDGNFGATDNVYAGGPYRVWFTDMYNCISHKDTVVPNAPETYFPQLPEGCYSLCMQQLPLLLYGVPNVRFDYYAWLKNGGVEKSGTDTLMGSYLVTTSGDYQWVINNGLCTQTSGYMSVSLTDCTCPVALLTGPLCTSIVCDPTNPASYNITITLTSPMPGTTYVIGTDMGPIVDFTGTLPTVGPQPPMNLVFTVVDYMISGMYVVLPDSITVEVQYTMPDGSKCFRKERIALPPCSWVAEKHGHTEDTTKEMPHHDTQPKIGSALLVFPNPSSGNVTASYDYGMENYKERTLTVYDQLGRIMQTAQLQDIHGSLLLNSASWTPGVYIIRMAVDGGRPLQTQKMVITH